MPVSYKELLDENKALLYFLKRGGEDVGKAFEEVRRLKEENVQLKAELGRLKACTESKTATVTKSKWAIG